MPKKTQNPNPLSTRDKYLLKNFEIDETIYKSQLRSQSESCAICCYPASDGTISLSVDHDHKIERWKVSTKRFQLPKPEKGKAVVIWKAFPENGIGELDFEFYGKTRKEVVDKVKKRLLRVSGRGILCHRCNSGLQKYRDNPDCLRAAAEYLERYYNFLQTKQENFYFG